MMRPKEDEEEEEEKKRRTTTTERKAAWIVELGLLDRPSMWPLLGRK